MLRQLNPRGQRLGGIIRQDRDLHLAQHRPVIKLRCHQMHAAPTMAITRINRAPVGFKPFVFGEQRGVNVEHPTLPFLHKRLAQYSHIAG